MRITRFEDIDAWQEARSLTKEVYELSELSRFSKDWGLAQQIQRAAVSIMSNICEGFDSGSRMEFIRFLGYARRSASEVQNHLYVAMDRNYISQPNFDKAYEQTEKVRRMVTAFIRYLKTQNTSTRERTNALTR